MQSSIDINVPQFTVNGKLVFTEWRKYWQSRFATRLLPIKPQSPARFPIIGVTECFRRALDGKRKALQLPRNMIDTLKFRLDVSPSPTGLVPSQANIRVPKINKWNGKVAMNAICSEECMLFIFITYGGIAGLPGQQDFALAPALISLTTAKGSGIFSTRDEGAMSALGSYLSLNTVTKVVRLSSMDVPGLVMVTRSPAASVCCLTTYMNELFAAAGLAPLGRDPLEIMASLSTRYPELPVRSADGSLENVTKAFDAATLKKLLPECAYGTLSWNDVLLGSYKLCSQMLTSIEGGYEDLIPKSYGLLWNEEHVHGIFKEYMAAAPHRDVVWELFNLVWSRSDAELPKPLIIIVVYVLCLPQPWNTQEAAQLCMQLYHKFENLLVSTICMEAVIGPKPEHQEFLLDLVYYIKFRSRPLGSKYDILSLRDVLLRTDQIVPGMANY